MSASSALIGLFYQSLIGVIELDFNYDVRFFAKLRDKSGVHLYLGIRILVLLRENYFKIPSFGYQMHYRYDAFWLKAGLQVVYCVFNIIYKLFKL